MKQPISILLIAVVFFSLVSCKKYLEAKPDNSLVIPSTVADLQALLDNSDWMNKNCPLIGDASSDNYFLTDVDFNALTNQRDKNVYTWGEELFYDLFPNGWSYCYSPVYYANTVLEFLPSIERTAKNQTDWDNVKGSAYLFRAKCLLTAVTLWAKAYDSSSASTDLGIPLRSKSDFNEPSTRASIQAVYDQVISDLKTSVPLLPVTPTHVLRPSKTAAYALLSRAFLYVQDFNSAGKYADSALQLKSDLIDFNSLSVISTAPFARFNAEVIMHTSSSSSSFIRNRIDSILIASYDANDLRKTLYFAKNSDAGYNFKGSYDGSTTPFCGITTDEMFITRAECYARTGNPTAALIDLNTLLKKRWKTATYVPYTITGVPNVLSLVLQERRKELVMRHMRWADIKRLNAKGAGIILTRVLNGQTITLGPNDARYALPIPANIISLTSMQQNPR